MKRLEKFERLRDIQWQIDRIMPSYREFNESYSGPLGIKIESPTGESVFIELYEREDGFRRHWDEASLRHIDNFIKMLSVPALRDEFEKAIGKIKRKGDFALEAAERVGKAPNPDNKDIVKKHETYKGNPLYDYEVEQQRILEKLNAEKLELCVELGLARRPNLVRYYENLPEAAEIERSYQDERRADETDAPNP